MFVGILTKCKFLSDFDRVSITKYNVATKEVFRYIIIDDLITINIVVSSTHNGNSRKSNNRNNSSSSIGSSGKF